MWFIVPAYFATISPVWFRLRGKSTLDFGRIFGGKPISVPLKQSGFCRWCIVRIPSWWSAAVCFWQARGVTVGRASGIWCHDGRRREVFQRGSAEYPGKSWFPFDQLDFVVGALVFSAAVETPTLVGLIIILVLTPPLHRLSNIIDHKIGLKEVPY